MAKTIKVTRVMTDDYSNDTYVNEFDATEDALDYTRGSARSSMTKSIFIEIVPVPEPKRAVARFTLLDHGVQAEGSIVKLTAEEWGRWTYGKETVTRLQKEIDADRESHSAGEVHSTIPDNANGADDTYGRRYSVLIASIETA